jgi:glycosyltransferase involved in cell wall biosynthesis
MTSSNIFKVSVIIPAYNCAKFIEETLASVLNQTQAPFEILVINDGSTDNTAEVVSKYPQIRLINKPNQGPSAARNTGIQESKGNWIAFLDSDDLWHTEKLEKIAKHSSNNPDTDMISSAFYVGNSKQWQKITPRRLYNSNDSFFEQLYRRSFIATSSVVIKKDFLTKSGGFDSELLVAEDLDLYLRIALMNAKFYYINEHLLYYRSHPHSITTNPLNAHQDIEKVFYKFRRQAGYELFVKRMLIWSATTVLTLYRQKRYFSLIYVFVRTVKNLCKSPFTYFLHDSNTYSPTTITKALIGSSK